MDRPLSVLSAVRIMLASIGLNLFLIIFYFVFPLPIYSSSSLDTHGQKIARILALPIELIPTLFICLLTYKIWQGKNWAKWLFIFTIILNVSFVSYSSIQEVWKTNQVGAIGSVLNMLLNIGVLVCLSLPSARMWFAERKYDL